MSTVTLTVFDPALCCPTGVCGPSVDEKLVRFAADLSWIESQGVALRRFNLSQEPGAFAEDADAKGTLERCGVEGLPLIKVDGVVKSTGVYPSRDELASWSGLSASAPSTSTGGGCCGPAKASAPTAAPASSEASPSKSTGCC